MYYPLNSEFPTRLYLRCGPVADVWFPKAVRPEDLIRLGKDLLHAYSILHSNGWVPATEMDYMRIHSISGAISRAGSSSVGAAALAETFKIGRAHV